MSEAEGKNNIPSGEDELGSTTSFGGATVRPGSHIGPYKLLRILGEGGFAVVYLAEQERPIRRRVALKIIKPGMDSKQVIARFEAERQALALLDHPNIAHVYDAGTTAFGHPYFVMECAKGVSLTEHCDRQKLTIDERLALFLQICEAVQHAHHKGIIHRDIKPSNIQVCIEGEDFIPKIIDFGVAKALSQRLTERTLVTEQGQMVGTPEYMSPEQAELTNQDIDTRTDIYSLGVLLYRLLTGKLPFDSEMLREGGIEHARQIICEESPRTPSTRVSSLSVEESTKLARSCQTDVRTLRRRLRGDLDWITLKAMEKDRTRRYQTAHALAEDIQRHLNHEPVVAGPPSKIYRLKKFFRKHQAQAIRAGTTAILLAAVVIISVMYFRARGQAQKAVYDENKATLSEAEQLRSNGEFEEALALLKPLLPSKHVGPEARLLRARVIMQLESPAEALEELRKLLDERAQTACKAHFLMTRIYNALAGDSADSNTEKEYRQKANEHKRRGDELFSPSAEAYFDRAMIAGSVDTTIDYLNKALQVDRTHYDSHRSLALAYYFLRDYWMMQPHALAMTLSGREDPLGYSLLAIAYRGIKNFAAAVESHRKAIELSPDDPELYTQRYETYLRMGDFRRALADAQRCVAIEPKQFVYQFNVFIALVSLKDYEAARQVYTKIVGADSAQQPQFEAWVGRYVFRVLGSGTPFELPEEIAQSEPFSTMQNAADYYRDLEAKADRLVPGVYGQSSWSQDEKKLAYGRSELYAWESKRLTPGAPALSGSGGIEVYDLESDTTRLLVGFGKDPAWSPDGKYIAFVREPYGVREYAEETWIVPAEGGKARRLALGAWPVWANDSRQIYFHSREDNTLYSIRIDDPTARREPIISCPSRFPGVSPDKRYVAYAERNKLQIVELSSRSVVGTWMAPVPTSEMLVRWSPDGKELSVAGDTGSDLGLWIFDVERKQAWQIFDAPAISGIWSPKRSWMVVEIKIPYEENWLVKLDPNLPTHESLADARTRQQYLQYMREKYTRAMDEDPNSTDMSLSKLALAGKEQYRMGVYEDVLSTFTQIDQLRRTVLNHQSRPRDIAFIVKSLHKLGRDQEAKDALGHLRRLFDDGKHLGDARYLYEAEQLVAGQDSRLYPVWECIKAGSLEEASKLAEALRSLPRPKDRETAVSVQSAIKALARAYYKRGRSAKHRGAGYRETIADYEAAIGIDPNFARAFSDLAYLQAAYPKADFHDGDQAIKNAERACELTNWKDHCYVSTLAAVYAELGDSPKAAKLQQQAIGRLSDSERATWHADYESRLRLYQSGKRYDKGNPCSFSTGRLVAWWKLDEAFGTTAVDSSGNNNTGRLVGDPRWQPSSGKVSGALELDGDGDYVELGNESIFDFAEEITAAAWVKIATVPAQWTGIVTKGNSAWRVSTRRSEKKFHFAVTGGGLDSSYVHGEAEVSADEWRHVAGTYDGQYIRLYVDGAEDPNKSPVAYSDGMTTNDFEVCIGGNSEMPGRCWNGLIDDVRIYSYALSPQEIRAICGVEGSSPAED